MQRAEEFPPAGMSVARLPSIRALTRVTAKDKVKDKQAALLVRSRSAALYLRFDQKMTAPHTREGMRGGCSPQNNPLVNELRAEGNKFYSA
jgi:hypothetical protein